ncbi:hypothetical protein SLS53_001606 [Cytospora paraplurivora]|uniref:Uncharacterized protein n=1 Tax=Cytospora paraplurivora TaxID=2898453 RepID=A0AAN9UR65_9PEZI
MAGILTTILECLFGAADDRVTYMTEKHLLLSTTTRARTPDEIAIDIVTILHTAEKNGDQLRRDLDDTISTTAGGWTEGICKATLSKLVDLISSENRAKLGPAMEEALEKAEEVADSIFDFARDHPEAVAIFVTILAIGVLWFMAPWVLEVLGFAAEGPIEGSFAAWWESTYAGYIPKGSLFSFFQRLAMKWPRA